MTDLSFTGNAARRGLLALAGVLLTLGALPASAASGIFTPPQGCTGFLTVQSHGCLVSNHYRCEGDAPGDQWRVDFGANGPYFISRTDREAQWVESEDLATREGEHLQPGAADPASFTQLLASGRDDFDFTTRVDDGTTRHYVGHDALTGESATIGGIALKQTQFAITATDGEGRILWRSSGHEFINPGWRLFFAGSGLWEDEAGKTRYDNTPVAFLQPGDHGFMSTVPLFDCTSVMSQRPTPALPVVPVKAVK